MRKKFTKYVSLNVLGMIALSCYILADTYFVSNKLGLNGLAALNLSIPVYCIINAIGLMIGIGGATKYTIYKTQSEDRKASTVFTSSLFLGITLGIIFALIGIFGSKIISEILGANNETLVMTNTYLKTLLSFSPFFIVNNVVLAFVRNDHSPKLAMLGMLIGSFSNIVLDFVFINIFNMQMFGAAFATGLAPIISLCVMLLHFTGGRNNLKIIRCKIKVKNLKNLLVLGISSFVTEISSGVILIVFNVAILGIAGNTGVAAYGIIANIALIAVAIYVGIANGIQPLVSKCYSRNEGTRLRKLLKYSILLSIIISIALYILLNLFSNQIVNIFNSENNISLISYAKIGFLVYFAGFLFEGINIITISFLSASANPKNSFILSILRGVVITIPLVFILPNIFGMNGVWIVFPIAEIITTLIAMFILCKNTHKYR